MRPAMPRPTTITPVLLLAALSSPPAFCADEPALEMHGQATYVRQEKPAFPAAYSGPRSLVAERAYGYSFTGTVFFGARLGSGWEAYFNPELVQGRPLSGLQGLGGFNNGESQRIAGPSLTAYHARVFGRKTWDLGGEPEERESEANQVRARYAARRFVLTAGNFSVLDVFDAVEYSRDPRTQFLDWASLTYGAWDYPADARGYTWGAAGEYITERWSLRAGHFLMPVQSNGLTLDRHFGRQYGEALELERPYALAGRKAVLRILGFRNRVNAGAFRDALAAASPPDVAQVRRLQYKNGLGVGTQVELAQDVGAYVRAGWSDGKTETYAFTEIDRSLAAGVLVKGTRWRRAEDSVGVAGYVNGLSAAHRDYLAAGGQGFFLGDGRLNYASERIVEIFYSLQVVRGSWLSADWQRITNPGYNRDRGPADTYNVRMHVEF
jgi:high affinity Mn2+ porin